MADKDKREKLLYISLNVSENGHDTSKFLSYFTEKYSKLLLLCLIMSFLRWEFECG